MKNQEYEMRKSQSLILLLSIAASVICLAAHAEQDAGAPTGVIERTRMALKTMEGPRQSLLEELGNAGTPEAEQLLLEAISFKVPKDVAPTPTEWQRHLENEVRGNAARQLIRLASPEIVPTLRLWLCEGSTNRVAAEHNQLLHVAITGLAEYSDTDSLATIEVVYQNSTCHSVVQEISADAIATIGAQSSTNLLRRMIWNDCLRIDTRCKIAAALVRHDINLGRDILLAFYELGIAKLKDDRSGGGGVARATLATLGDSALIQRLTERAAREPPSTVQKNITTLIDEMKICALPLDDVTAMATDSRWAEGMYRRYPAIHRLGRDGSIKEIAVLESLRPWDSVGTGAYTIQQQTLRDITLNSVREIKRRNWQYFAK